MRIKLDDLANYTCNFHKVSVTHAPRVFWPTDTSIPMLTHSELSYNYCRGLIGIREAKPVDAKGKPREKLIYGVNVEPLAGTDILTTIKSSIALAERMDRIALWIIQDDTRFENYKSPTTVSITTREGRVIDVTANQTVEEVIKAQGPAFAHEYGLDVESTPPQTPKASAPAASQPSSTAQTQSPPQPKSPMTPSSPRVAPVARRHRLRKKTSLPDRSAQTRRPGGVKPSCQK